MGKDSKGKKRKMPDDVVNLVSSNSRAGSVIDLVSNNNNNNNNNEASSRSRANRLRRSMAAMARMQGMTLNAYVQRELNKMNRQAGSSHNWRREVLLRMLANPPNTRLPQQRVFNSQDIISQIAHRLSRRTNLTALARTSTAAMLGTTRKGSTVWPCIVKGSRLLFETHRKGGRSTGYYTFPSPSRLPDRERMMAYVRRWLDRRLHESLKVKFQERVQYALNGLRALCPDEKRMIRDLVTLQQRFASYLRKETILQHLESMSLWGVYVAYVLMRGMER